MQKYFNDLKLGSDFQKGLEELLEGNESVRLADLKRQLTQKQSEVVLGEIPIHSVLPNRLYDQVSKSVLVMGRLYNCGKCSKWHTSMASAFAIGQDGIIVTNHHVLAEDECCNYVDGRRILVFSFFKNWKQKKNLSLFF